MEAIPGKPVPLEVSIKLQTQIRFLCSEVSDVEWSGTLFYRTEGQFGTEGFKVFAEELFLQDIGTAAYTEYDGGQPEFIKFMMENQHVLADGWKRGHIHSHNSMSVFFSGTDSDELIDNSEFYNFYLSLIVNNKNHMCAKIAFRAKSSEERKIAIVFKNENGEETKKEITTQTDIERVYAYDCAITKPEVIQDSFRERLSVLIELKRKAAQEAAAKKSATAYSGFNVQERYNQAYAQGGLFDDAKGVVGKRVATKTQDKGDWKAYEDWEVGEMGIPQYEPPTSGSRVDGRTYDLLVKLLNLDLFHEGSLTDTLHKIYKRLYKSNTGWEVKEQYHNLVEDKAVTFYVDVFPEDVDLVGFDDAMENCIGILSHHQDKYPELIDALETTLNIQIDDNPKEQETRVENLK